MISFIKNTEFDLTAAEPFGISSFQLSKILKLIQEISKTGALPFIFQSLSAACGVFSALRFELTVVIGNVKFFK